MRIHDILTSLETIAPLSLAESWDRVGLQIGDARSRAGRAMLCIDLTEAVVKEARAARASLIVAYHPPIFEPIKSLASNDWKSRAIASCIRAGIAVYSPHTALDAAEGGINDWLIAGLGKGCVTPIKPAAAISPTRCKVVVFTPASHGDALREAMSKAGAGGIGDYAECSFSSPGQGTFRGAPSTRPAIGKAGRLERVNELRMECICDMKRVPDVLAALRAVHPYEEPAIDLYRLESPPGSPTTTGQGRVIELDDAVSLPTLTAMLKRRLAVRTLFVGAPTPRRTIRRVAVCAGAGGSLLGEAREIDAFITGEMRHHDMLSAVEQGTAILLAGHTQTERPYLKEYRRRILTTAAAGVDWRISKEDGRCWR